MKKAAIADRFVIRSGFEPETHSLEGCCSIQLSYQTKQGDKDGANRVQRTRSLPRCSPSSQPNCKIRVQRYKYLGKIQNKKRNFFLFK